MNKRTIFLSPLIHTHFQFSLNFTSKATHTQLPNLAICIASLQECAHHQNLTTGKQLHSCMLRNGVLDVSPLCTTSLINMYSKCNCTQNSLSVFKMSTFKQNVFIYNALIAGFAANDLPKYAFEFYREMRLAGVMPDKFTFPCAIKACSDVVDVLEARKIHALLFKSGLEFDLFIGSALAHACLKFGLMGEAIRVFEELPVRNDVVLWNAMINGYSQMEQFDGAMDVFSRMNEEGVVPNKFTVTGVMSALAMIGDLNNGQAVHGLVVKMGFDSGIAVSNSLIDMYGKCKCIKDASNIFEWMVEKDIYSWNSALCIHLQCGDHEKTLILFDRMLRALVQPDLVTATTVLPSCSHLAALMLGRQIHGYMIVNGLGKGSDVEVLEDKYLWNAVMDMYAKCGNLMEAQLVFDKLTYRDVASWNIMIVGYGILGFGIEALNVFHSMCEAQVKPDDITFVGILSACSHAGLVEHGRKILAEMLPKYGVLPTIEHYTCVIDMLGRAGKLEEAYELLSSMPIESNPVVWRAFLAACRLHGSTALAEVAAQRVFELDPEHCGSYVLMSNVYGAIGRYEEVSEVRHSMRKQSVKKAPGRSWI